MKDYIIDFCEKIKIEKNRKINVIIIEGLTWDILAEKSTLPFECIWTMTRIISDKSVLHKRLFYKQNEYQNVEDKQGMRDWEENHPIII